MNSELIAGLQHPVMGKIEGNFKLDTISKFNFEDLQVKVMDAFSHDEVPLAMRIERVRRFNG